MTTSTRARNLTGAIALLAGLLVLAGCGSDGKTVVTGNGDKVSVNGDKVTVDTGDGTATLGAGLPDGFPRDAVPLVDGKVVSGVKGTPGARFAWSVVLQTSSSVEAVTAQVKKDYAAAGYRAGQASVMGDVSILQFKNSTYEVGITASRTAGNVTVTYVVQSAG